MHQSLKYTTGSLKYSFKYTYNIFTFRKLKSVYTQSWSLELGGCLYKFTLPLFRSKQNILTPPAFSSWPHTVVALPKAITLWPGSSWIRFAAFEVNKYGIYSVCILSCPLVQYYCWEICPWYMWVRIDSFHCHWTAEHRSVNFPLLKFYCNVKYKCMIKYLKRIKKKKKRSFKGPLLRLSCWFDTRIP